MNPVGEATGVRIVQRRTQETLASEEFEDAPIGQLQDFFPEAVRFQHHGSGAQGLVIHRTQPVQTTLPYSFRQVREFSAFAPGDRHRKCPSGRMVDSRIAETPCCELAFPRW